jgi:hypothetical protein
MPKDSTPRQTERERLKKAINKIWLDTKPGHFDEDIIAFILADRKEYARALLERAEKAGPLNITLGGEDAPYDQCNREWRAAIEAERGKL